jgi:WD40 repeat protein
MNKHPLLIQDAYDFGPPLPKSREAPWEKLYRFFFGDDVFISYSRADAIRYVPSLAARLAAKGHICFFDQLAADPSKDLPERLKKKILRSTVFVLVGTKGAVASSFVRNEVELFRRTRRPFIPVDVDGTLIEQEGWRDVVGVAKIREEGARVRDGDPSPEVVNLIKDSFRYTRRSQWLRASLLAGVSVILITVAASLLLIRAAEAGAAAIKRRAEADVTAAEKKVAEAQQDLQNITAEAARLRADADAARNRAESATAQAEAASTRQRSAELAMRRAQRLERQAAMRGADTARREAGSRAALLAREPGRELDALALAVEAAEQSGARWGNLPDEVLAGLTASAAAADYSLPLADAETLDVTGMYISPNGEKIVASVYNSTEKSTEVVFWDGRTGKRLSAVPVAGLITDLSFSRDGRRLAAIAISEEPPKLFVWDLNGPQPRRLETACGERAAAFHVALDSDGTHLLIGKGRRIQRRLNLTVCELATGREEAMPEPQRVFGLAFTPDDEPAVYVRTAEPGANEAASAVYFPRSGRTVALKSPGVPPHATLAGIGDDGSIIIPGDSKEPGQGRVYAQGTDGEVRLFTGFRGIVFSATLVAGRARVVTLTGRGARVADAVNSPDFAALRSHTRRLDIVAFSPDGRTALTVGDDGKARLWDAQTGHPRHTLAMTDESPAEGPPPRYRHQKLAAFRADGARLVTSNEKGEIHVWDVGTGRPVCSAPTPGLRTWIQASPSHSSPAAITCWALILRPAPRRAS